MDDSKNRLTWDLVIIAISVAVGIILIKTEAVRFVLGWAGEARIIASFLGGMFFSSIFTAFPATIALGEIAREYSIFWTAFFGGLGALLGDFLIFRFFRDEVSEALLALFSKPERKRWAHIFRLKIFRWIFPLIGAIIIASPLPDEIGLVIWGATKMPNRYFAPLSFALNSLGILIIGLIARAI